MTFRLNGFDSIDGQKALARVEGILKDVYNTHNVSKKDLELRDLVIKRVSDAFHTSNK